MRLVRFAADGVEGLGVLDPVGESVVSVDSVVGKGAGSDLSTLLEGWTPALAEALGSAGKLGGGRPLTGVRLLAPCAPVRRNVFCVGKNYREHVAEIERSGFVAATQGPPLRPAIFTKATTAVIGPEEGIPAHAGVTSAIDYEAELAVVIGPGGHAIPAEKAWEHVFGYTILNDVTARDLQRDHQQWFLGKSLDGFCPVGPYVATRDELDGANLELRCWVNGELRQSANTGELITDIPTLIATISAAITLLPGDLIATGTPQGVGVGFDPPRFLSVGDEVTIEISGLGRLSNRVVAG
ncbi:MAG: fumarylacetoacetate hydrolase family protein [Candidatus Dormiibacterota bacterium]